MNSKEYKVIKKLGEELGMNVFGLKNFNMRKKKFKIHTRVCYRCNKKHKIKRDDGILSNSKRLCSDCRKKSNLDTMEKRKIKNKNKWEQLILNVLKKENKKMSLKSISKKIGCSTYPIRATAHIMLKEKKIKSFIGPKLELFLLII